MAIPLLPRVSDKVRVVYTGDPAVDSDGYIGWVTLSKAQCAGDADVCEFHPLTGEQLYRVVRLDDPVEWAYTAFRLGCSGKGTVGEGDVKNGDQLTEYINRLPSLAILHGASYIMALTNGTDPHIRPEDAEPVGESG